MRTSLPAPPACLWLLLCRAGGREPAVQLCQWGGRRCWGLICGPRRQHVLISFPKPTLVSSFSFLGNNDSYWLHITQSVSYIMRNPCLFPLPPLTTGDVTEKVPVINTVVGKKWVLISAGDLVVVGCQHAFFHIGLLLQGLMLADYNSVASHFRFIWTYFSSLLSFHWLASIQTHCNSSESLSPSDGSIYKKFS